MEEIVRITPPAPPRISALSASEHTQWVFLHGRHERGIPLSEREQAVWDALQPRAAAEQAAYRDTMWQAAYSESPSRYHLLRPHAEAEVEALLGRSTRRAAAIYAPLYSREARIPMPPRSACTGEPLRLRRLSGHSGEVGACIATVEAPVEDTEPGVAQKSDGRSDDYVDGMSE